MTASLREFRDLDVMFKIVEGQDNEGWVETEWMAEALGLRNGNVNQAVGQRLAWMRRFGMVEYDREKHLWRLSPSGERVTEARMRAAHTKTIEALPDELMVDVMSKVTQRYMHGSPMVAHMLRREFQFGTQRR